MDANVEPAVFDIKVVESHHMAHLVRYSKNEVHMEVMRLGRVRGREVENARYLFTLVRQRSRHTSLEEGIISADGRYLLLKFKL